MTDLLEASVTNRDSRWRVHNALIHPELADRAGGIALELMRQHQKLPFIHRYSTAGNHQFATVGIGDPEKGDALLLPSIYSSKAWRKIAQPLLNIVATVQENRPIFKAEEIFRISILRPSRTLPMHMDLGKSEEHVSVACLQGASMNTLIDPATDERKQFFQLPGDEYGMVCTDDEQTSPLHEVDVITAVPRIALLMTSERS